MKKISFLCIVAGVLMSSSALADEAVMLKDDFDSIDFWATKSSCFSASGGKLVADTANIAGEQTIYKYNGTNSKTYLRTNIGSDYKIEADIQIDDFFDGDISSGYSAGVTVINSAYEMTMYLAKDGIYVKSSSGTEKYDYLLDSETHLYKVIADDDIASVYIDDEYLFNWIMPENTGKDDVKILAKGTASDRVKFSVDNLTLSKIYDTKVLFDDMTSFDKAYQTSNLEYATYDSAFFSGNYQVDMIDQTQSSEIIYKIPDGAELTGFTISVRKHPQYQADVYLAFSKDGTAWTGNYTSTNYKYTWFYANGGHRYLMTPGTVPYKGMSYIKITIVPNIGGPGGPASESSPSLMCTEIYYTVPEFKNVKIGGKEIKDGDTVSANINEIEIDFSTAPDAESAVENITLESDGNIIDTEVEVDGNSAILKINDFLDFGTEYSLNIGSGIKSQSGATFDGLEKNYRIKTFESDFKMENVSFSEENEEISATADITNTSGKDMTVTLVIIGYKDGLMTGFNTCEKKINHMGKATLNSGNMPSGADRVEVMLWDNLKDMTALTPVYIK